MSTEASRENAGQCYLHSRRPATLSCEVCARPICNACVQNAATRLTCPACLDDARRGGRRGRGLRVLAAVALLAVGGALFFALGDDSTTDDAEAAGSTKRYAAARLEAQKDPDDPHKWLRVAEILIEENQLAAAREPLMTAVRLDPDDPEIQARLGYYEYELGREAEALAILEKAQALGSDDPALETTLASIRGRLAEDEERRAALAEEQQAAELARVQARRARAEAVAARAEALTAHAERLTERERAAAAEEAAVVAEADQRRFEAESCSMPVQRSGNAFVVPVQLNGVDANLLYDTGASGLMLSHTVARRAGIELDPADTLEAQTANGTAYFLRADLRSLTIAGGVLEHVRCAVCRAGDPCLGGAVDGLLGVQVMEALGMTLDAAASRVRFANCD